MTNESRTRQGQPDRFALCGAALFLAVLLALPAFAQTEPAMTQSDPVRQRNEELLNSLPDHVRESLMLGEPEFALRLLRESAPADAASLEDLRKRQIRAVYRYAVNLRIDEEAEGAVVQLIRHAPSWLNDDRQNAARRLTSLWREDPNPNRRSLERRMEWFREIQESLRPAPFDPELPVTLILLALDEVDHNERPADLVMLLEIADRVAPGHPIFESYRPDDFYMLRAAEQLERERKYLAAGEIYRRLIYRTEGDADWFRRQYAENQLSRVYAMAGSIGSDYATQAAARLRQEFLDAEELGRFRILKENLRDVVGQNNEKRRIPASIEGDLTLDPLPVGYLIEDKVFLQKGGHLVFKPGSVVRGGGRLVLEGGRVTFEGTEDEPVYVIGIIFESDDIAGGGIVAGQNVHFRNCAFRRSNNDTLPGAMRWRMDRTYVANCSLPFDPHVDVEWTESVFDATDIRFPLQPVDHLQPNDPDGHEFPFPGAYADIRGCRFIDCRTDDITPIRVRESQFIDCAIPQFSRYVHRTHASEDAAESEMMPRQSIRNQFIPRGGIPALINRRALFDERHGPYEFAEFGEPTTLDLGRVRLGSTETHDEELIAPTIRSKWYKTAPALQHSINEEGP